MSTALARTGETGRAIAHGGLSDGALRVEETGTAKKGAFRVYRSERAMDALDLPLHLIVDLESLPTSASEAAGYLLANGHLPREMARVEVYRGVTRDRKTGEMREVKNKRRAIVYCRGERYQSIGGVVFVGYPKDRATA